MWRKIRIVISCLFLFLCIGFVAWWMQGYKSLSEFGVHSPIFGTHVFANRAGIIIFAIDLSQEVPSFLWQWRSRILRDIELEFPSEISYLERSGLLGFHIEKKQWRWTGRIPHGFFVVVTGAMAILFRPKPRLKFSLRGLLILTTVVAIVLGAVEALARFST